MEIITLTPENVEEHTFFCIKNIKEEGFKAKQRWFNERIKEGMEIKLLYADDKKLVGFIEYLPAENAWRPVDATGYVFIHCIFVYPNKYRSTGVASVLIDQAVDYASQKGMDGVCTMTSQGPWIATKKLFQKRGFEKTDKLGRFELMTLKLNAEADDPKLINWEEKLPGYEGWHLLYADQCPWHDKGVQTIKKTAADKNIDLKVSKISSSEEAKKVPSGFGVFALVKDGKLLEDHYISKRRFETIIEKELELS